MKPQLFLSVATIALIGAGAQAHAQNYSSDTNSYDDFTGIYGGGQAGYGFTEDLKGWQGGVFLGYGMERDIDLLGAYGGLELGYDWGNFDGDTAGVPYEKDHAWNITFRPGVTIQDNALAYGIVGYSRGAFESNGAEDDLDGMILGAGAQFDTNSAFKPRLEYTYTNYEDATVGGTNIDANENAVKLGGVLQF